VSDQKCVIKMAQVHKTYDRSQQQKTYFFVPEVPMHKLGNELMYVTEVSSIN